MDGRGMPQPPDPGVVAELIATSRELGRYASEAMARARRLCEQSRELLASGRGAALDGTGPSGSTCQPSHQRMIDLR